jgi:hypothetical protein
VLSQAGAPLSWTSERAGTLFACERARKAAANTRQPQRAERTMCTERGDLLFVPERRRSRRLAMFAPPISQQIARAQRAPAPAASCVQEEMAEQRFSVPTAPTKTAATRRTSQRAERAIRRSAIRVRDVRAADLQEELTKRAKNQSGCRGRSFRRIRRRRRLPGEHRSEWSEPLDTACDSERSNQTRLQCSRVQPTP